MGCLSRADELHAKRGHVPADRHAYDMHLSLVAAFELSSHAADMDVLGARACDIQCIRFSGNPPEVTIVRGYDASGHLGLGYRHAGDELRGGMLDTLRVYDMNSCIQKARLTLM